MNRELIEKVIKLEFKQFQSVSNRGGRASCQDDFKTFEIMRSSQFSVWTEPVLQSYYSDLTAAESDGRNLPEEKYGYMMEETFPEEFNKIKDKLPHVSCEKERLISEIMVLQTAMTEVLYKKYPFTCSHGRPLSPDPERLYSTSAMTYLRGELCTYSEATLALYLDMLQKKHAAGENLPIEILEETVRRYGYENLDAHEKYLRGKAGESLA